MCGSINTLKTVTESGDGQNWSLPRPSSLIWYQISDSHHLSHSLCSLDRGSEYLILDPDYFM